MKTFQVFVRESPFEHEGVVNISQFLPNAVMTSLQPLVPDIKNAVASGDIKPRTMLLNLRSLYPTQHTISLPKVTKSIDRYHNATLPLVIVYKGHNVLLDGHHRVCGAMMGNRTRDEFAVISAADLSDWLETKTS